MTDRGRTVREAIAIALEGIPGQPDGWLFVPIERAAVREHVIGWIQDYAQRRNVILDVKKDIEPELDLVIKQLRGIAIARTRT